jgi:hypothetical protein
MNLPQCSTCKIYRNGCPVHPQGVLGDDCLDFRLKYETGFTPQLTKEEQWRIFNTHPIFSGKCPQCSHIYNQLSDRTNWTCPVCNWHP